MEKIINFDYNNNYNQNLKSLIKITNKLYFFVIKNNNLSNIEKIKICNEIDILYYKLMNKKIFYFSIINDKIFKNFVIKRIEKKIKKSNRNNNFDYDLENYLSELKNNNFDYDLKVNLKSAKIIEKINFIIEKLS